MVSSPGQVTYSRVCVFILFTVCVVYGIQVTTVDDGYLVRYEIENEDEFTLPCQYTLESGESEQTVQITWSKDGQLVYSINRTAGELNEPTFEDGYTVVDTLGPDLGTPGNADLVLLNPSRDDQGTWTCQANSFVGGDSGIDEMNIEHYIYYGPYFIFYGDNPTSGDMNFMATFGLVELTCHAEAFPPVQLTWKRVDDTETLPNDTFFYRDEEYGGPEVEKVLEANFGNTSNKYTGEYECQAVADQNTIDGVPEDLVGKLPAGPTVSHNIIISMYEKPYVKAGLGGDSDVVTAPVGHNEIRLICIVLETPSPPINRVIWLYLNDLSRQLEESDDDSEDGKKYKYDTEPQEFSILYIYNIKESDFGDYSCTFKNDIGSASAIVIFEDGPAPVTPFDPWPPSKAYSLQISLSLMLVLLAATLQCLYF